MFLELTDVTLADEDAYSMPVDSLLRVMLVNLKWLWIEFGREFEAECWSKFWGYSLVKIWKIEVVISNLDIQLYSYVFWE